MNSGEEHNRKVSLMTLIRFTPPALAFLYSLLYSALMGLENRSFLTFVMLTNTLLSFVLLSGLGLRIRNSSSTQESKELVPAFVIISVFTSLLITTISFLALIGATPQLKFLNGGVVPNNALKAILLYFFMSSLSIPFFDLLSSLQSLRSFIIVEILVVVVQILVFLLLTLFNQTSFFVSALLAYSLSYGFLVFASLIVIISYGHFSFNLNSSFKQMFKFGFFNYYFRGFLLNLVERIDKLLVPLFYASPQLAQISVFTSILNFSRVVPDTQIRFKLNGILNNKVTVDEKLALGSVRTYSLMFFVISCGYFLVWITLGNSWLLPLKILVLLVIYEITISKVKESLSISGSVYKKRHKAFNLALATFYLIVLPIMMYRFDYITVLVILIVFISFYIIINRVRAKSELI